MDLNKKLLLSPRSIDITLRRLTQQLIENHGDFRDSVLIGLQPRGIAVLEKVLDILKGKELTKIASGTLDTTFFRDDFRRRDTPLQPSKTKIDVLLENKKVVFIDDVLFTGRSVRSAMDAVQSFGRPAEIELLVLIDRRFSRELPIQPDYSGQHVDSLIGDKVLVEWKHHGATEDAVYLETGDNNE
ncbi:MAG: pyrimidine operon attenuation protein/uracil phosphoribosyltransferase [Ulvibacter sp.]|jgi:pyrimidine operon attenuation protein/uracil phosphoribosyltransferase